MEIKRNVSVSALLDRVKDGDEDALEEIWQIYYPRLISLAEHNLKGSVPVSDADDIAQSTLKSFYFRVQEKRFPDLDDRNSLWKLLVTIALNKARATRRKEFHRRELLEQRWNSPSRHRVDARQFDDVMLEFQSLIDALADPSLKNVALARFEGYTNKEIAEQLGKSEPTVERKVRLIRDIWSKSLD